MLPAVQENVLQALKRGTLHREGTGLPGQGRNILKRPCLVCIAAVVGFSGVDLNVSSEGRNNADSAVRRPECPSSHKGVELEHSRF